MHSTYDPPPREGTGGLMSGIGLVGSLPTLHNPPVLNRMEVKAVSDVVRVLQRVDKHRAWARRMYGSCIRKSNVSFAHIFGKDYAMGL